MIAFSNCTTSRLTTHLSSAVFFLSTQNTRYVCKHMEKNIDAAIRKGNFFWGRSILLFSTTVDRFNNNAKLATCSSLSKESNIQSSNATQKVPVKRGEEVTVKIQGLVTGGDGISRIGRYVVMVPHSVPGQVVKVVITRVRSSYANAKVVQVVEESPYKVEPVCKHFGPFGCGGCKFQHISYDKQLEEKYEQILRHYEGLFTRLASSSCAEKQTLKPMIGSPLIYGYRNKMEFTFGNRRWIPIDLHQQDSAENESISNDQQVGGDDFVLGLKPSGHFDKVLPIEYCHLQESIANEIMNFVQKRTAEMQTSAYDVYSHQGFLRNLVIRTANNIRNEMEVMVNFVTSFGEDSKLLQPLALELAKEFPCIKSIVQNFTTSKGGASRGEEEQILFGCNYIQHYMLGRTLRFTANCFFQTNPLQTEKLYQLVREAANLNRKDVLLDLFCGIGSIGLCLASDCKYVYGIDVVEEAIQMAKVNAEINQVKNAEFILANLEKSSLQDPEIQRLFHRNGILPPNVVIVDPPRGGLHSRLIKWLRWLKPNRIIYVSCNPATQVRDLESLCLVQRYRLVSVQPIDMFPHTPHMECIAVLERM
ncbi:hypothetical protein GAYE_SCF04G2416 [Galdieria yellowstonensis]|uniref:TRAM domain-containing protein n=1 Tax=Galdieria yellowstonensis TaxID=3028027 RepID=A0AAV9IAR3_9RHOD|nr:hypothetical protein GAYE_SCF04G2416 [Galdieria yellowstonensis]